MLSKAFVGIALVLGTLAAPRNSTFSSRQALAKRAVPSFESGAYSPEHMEQIDDGHWDAIMMASTVVDYTDNRPPPDGTPYWFDEIFKKYFNIDDMPTVIGKPQRLILQSKRLTNSIQTFSGASSTKAPLMTEKAIPVSET